MSKQALAIKYRPKRFNDVVEQDVTKAILCEQLKNKTFKNCLLFCGGAGTGKAQPLDSHVLTLDDFIEMRDVKVGTKVVTGNDNIANVIGVYPQGKRKIYEIFLSNGDSFKVSDNHLNVIYNVVNGNFKESIVTTKKLLKCDYENTFICKVIGLHGMRTYYNIADIKYIGKEECQCILVDAEEHTYITDNYIITHNTTSARIFANEINDFKGRVIERDAASNNSVEDARKLIDEAYTQSMDSEYKVFVLDECHMLSNAAWNALLKLFEEPPKKSIFILATTNPEKIPDTILSRVQRYNFQKISLNGIINRLKYIIEQENKEDNNITFEDSALEHIAKTADGGMRNAITMLDKAIGYNSDLTLNNVLEALGSVSYDIMFDLTDALNIMNKKAAITIIEDIHATGLDLKQFIKQYNYFVLDLCKYDLFRDFTYLQIPEVYKERFDKYDENAFAFFTQLLSEISALNNKLKWETMPKPVVESTLLQLCSEV